MIKCCKHYTMYTRAFSRCGSVHAHHYDDQKSVTTLSELHFRVHTGVHLLLSRCCHHRCSTNLGRRWQQTYLNMMGSILIVMDNFSRYIELVELHSKTAEHVIVALKSIFARRGIPTVVCSDNGPYYAATSFQQFAIAYSFQNISSSPRSPQAHGEAERGLQIANSLLRKVADPYLAFLAYRVTPTHTEYSPTQLLMGRQLRYYSHRVP